MTLSIGLIARTLNAPHLRGTGRYVQELLKNTGAGDGVRWTAFGGDPSQPFRVPACLQGRAEVFDFRGDRFHLWEQLGLPLRLRRGGIQLLHGAENTLPVWQPVPSVVTIHDTVLWAEAGQGMPNHRYLHNTQRLALRHCAHVITISESSRRDIAQRWPFLSDRLTVIPHGIADDFFGDLHAPLPAVLRKALGDSPYLLYLGGAQARKRFDWALELLARSGRDDLHLVACGFGAGTAPLDRIPESLRSRVHFAPFVEDGELVSLYRGAQAAIYPTLYEGFGFPAVEAQAAGTPVLFSPVSSLVDLVGPLAWTNEVEDFDGWLASLREVLALPAHARAERAAEGAAWARRFSWRRSVEAHFAVYREVIERTGKRR
ncbi:glycosyltransferase family 4 protein [Roseateles violae]|uniref:Glycosyltransferase family 1 protein n=1 Tax=Roseateles violae TaxID=3058042 RepID=A0ABT8DQ42_9BURK|nr:glycosyltransferase family 1 protein [Pelomonas sp. PFR6]MDN3920469.1 glycosyltransferase family 1 protein [Pelomonas sp. PFR6]